MTNRLWTPSFRALWFIAFFLAGFAMPLPAQTAESLSQVQKLYFAPFDGEKAAQQLRQELIKRLGHSKYKVVDTAAECDAIVHGSGHIWIKGYLTTNWRSPSTNRQAAYGGYLSVELTGKAGETLWSYLVTPSKLLWTNITDDLAGNMAKEMIAASEHPAEPHAAHQDNLAPASLTGAGATFPAPLYQKWFQSFQQRYPTVRIAYKAIGSEQGANLLAEGKVDFAASDVSSPDLGNPKLQGNFRRIAPASPSQGCPRA